MATASLLPAIEIRRARHTDLVAGDRGKRRAEGLSLCSLWLINQRLAVKNNDCEERDAVSHVAGCDVCPADVNWVKIVEGCVIINQDGVKK